MLKKNLSILLCVISVATPALGMESTESFYGDDHAIAPVEQRRVESTGTKLVTNYKQAIDDEPVTIKTQEGQEFKVAVQLVKLSVTIDNLIDYAGTKSAIELPNVTSKIWNTIEPLLRNLFAINAGAQDAQQKKEDIITALKNLDSADLIEFIKAVNYLDIPLLLRLAIDVAKEIEISKISPEMIVQLPKDIGNAIIFGQALHILGPQPLKKFGGCMGHYGMITAVCVTPDYKIVSGDVRGDIRVWDMAGNLLDAWRGHIDWVRALCVTHDNKIVSASDDCTVRLWDMAGKPLAVCNGHTSIVLSVCATHDNKKIISGSTDCTVRIWNMAGKQLAQHDHSGLIYSVHTTPDNTIVTRSDDAMVRIWNMAGDLLGTCNGCTDKTRSSCITPDNKKIVSGNDLGMIYVWDVAGELLVAWQGHKEPIHSVCGTPDNKIISASYDRTVRLWDMAGNQLALCRVPLDGSQLECVTRDNKIVSGSFGFGNAVQIWDMSLVNRMLSIDRLQAQEIWEYLQGLSKDDLESLTTPDPWQYIISLIDPVEESPGSCCTVL